MDALSSLIFWSIIISYLLIAPSWSFVGDAGDNVDSDGTVVVGGPF